MHAMVRSLVDWVRAVDNSEGHSGATNAAVVLSQALESRRRAIQEVNAEVVVGPLPAVQMQASHLQRIWEHLLDDALRYRRAERPRIEIFANRGNSGWKFAIQDNGVGVAAVAYERIFGVFKRLNRTDEPGMGMGLAISRRIVQHYGGRIWVESQPGEGSKFFFTIPDADRRPAPAKVK